MESKKRCPFCAEEILAAAIKCKHCHSSLDDVPTPAPVPLRNAGGSLTRETGIARQIVGVLVVTAFFIYVLRHWPAAAEPGQADSSTQSLESAEISHPIAPIGPTQAQFCSVVLDWRKRYQDAESSGANEAALSELRHDRQQAFASLMTSRHVADWTGYLRSLTTSSDGAASVSLHLSCDERSRASDRVKAALDDMADDHLTLWNSRGLPRGTDLYSTVMKLREGAKLRVSGDFVIDGLGSRHDYVRINDLTERGSMTDPTFVFWYTAVVPMVESASTHSTRDAAMQAATDSAELSDKPIQPSFSCHKAQSAAEKLICADPDLAVLDNKYAARYKDALAVASDKEALVKLSRRELQRRQRECTDKNCLVSWYVQRLEVLDGVVAAPDVTPDDTSQLDNASRQTNHDQVYFTDHVKLVIEDLKRCVSKLPRPLDGIWAQMQPAINDDVRRCGQDYIAFWRSYGLSERLAFLQAVVEAFPAAGCRYTDLNDVDLDTKAQATRPISCSS